MRDRRRSQRWGRHAESIAAAYLRLKGYRIAARNHRTRGGEVDIVARRGTMVAFVEVKARASADAALMAVTAESQRRIESAGRDWVARQRDGASLNFRNDVVAIVPWRWPRHFENVW